MGPDDIQCSTCGNWTKIRRAKPGRLIGVPADWNSVKKFYARFNLNFEDAVRYSDRRVLYGQVLVSSGLNELDGRVILISFDQDALYIHDGDGYEIPYEQIRFLEIVSRDEVFAVPPRDIVAALAADALAAKFVSPSESILAVGWRDGSFVVLIRSLRPEELVVVLEPYISRVPGAPSDES
ncbi:MAG: hypothetical protein WAK12_10590 [Acidimicrobiales bacterium]